MRKLLSRQRVKTSKLQSSKVDIWLSRLSHLSQIGILAVATFGYFYTVIPVYEKSLLDEQISKKEIELKDLEDKLNKSYSLNRSGFIEEYISESTDICSGKDSQAYKNIKAYNAFKDFNNVKQLSYKEKYKEFFEINPENCLVQLLNKSAKAKKALGPEDLKILTKEVELISRSLETTRQSKKKEFIELDKKYLSNPEAFKNSIAEIIIYGSGVDKKPKTSDVDWLIEERFLSILHAYHNEVDKQISNIRNIKWANP